MHAADGCNPFFAVLEETNGLTLWFGWMRIVEYFRSSSDALNPLPPNPSPNNSIKHQSKPSIVAVHTNYIRQMISYLNYTSAEAAEQTNSAPLTLNIIAQNTNINHLWC